MNDIRKDCHGMINKNMAWKCALCAFAALRLVILINHYISRHAGSDSHAIKCNLNGCTKEYTNLRSFASHVHRKHSMFLQCEGPSETGGEPTMTTSDMESSKYLSIDKLLVATNRNYVTHRIPEKKRIIWDKFRA